MKQWSKEDARQTGLCAGNDAKSLQLQMKQNLHRGNDEQSRYQREAGQQRGYEITSASLTHSCGRF
jgi:hypothetical protein